MSWTGGPFAGNTMSNGNLSVMLDTSSSITPCLDNLPALGSLKSTDVVKAKAQRARL
jgi:hypothetical protein